MIKLLIDLFNKDSVGKTQGTKREKPSRRFSQKTNYEVQINGGEVPRQIGGEHI